MAYYVGLEFEDAVHIRQTSIPRNMSLSSKLCASSPHRYLLFIFLCPFGIEHLPNKGIPRPRKRSKNIIPTLATVPAPPHSAGRHLCPQSTNVCTEEFSKVAMRNSSRALLHAKMDGCARHRYRSKDIVKQYFGEGQCTKIRCMILHFTVAYSSN